MTAQRRREVSAVSSLGVDLEPQAWGAHEEVHAVRLPRLLSGAETWGFGFTGLLLWLFVAEGANSHLGPAALVVWVAVAAGGVLFNLQVRRLAQRWPEVSGGTPIYVARLLGDRPWLARYAAMAYFQAWASVPALSGFLLAEITLATLQPLGLEPPVLVLRAVLTGVAFVVAFGGGRTLAALHLFFLVPAVGGLLLFCLHGLGWLALAPASPGLLPERLSVLSSGLGLAGFAKWYFVGVYSAYGADTASSFMADSRRPRTALRCLEVAAALLPLVYIGGSWVVNRLGGGSTDITGSLTAAALRFWGPAGSWMVLFLVATACLLSSATAVAMTPRVLFQLARDGHAAPVFGVVSGRGVLGPGLIMALAVSLSFLAWGDATTALVVSVTGYFSFCTLLRLTMWMRRGSEGVAWPRLSLAVFAVEATVLVIGGLTWGFRGFVLGLVLPAALIAVDTVVSRVSLAPFQPAWWLDRYRRFRRTRRDTTLSQVGAHLTLVCVAAAAGWAVAAASRGSAEHRTAALVLLIVVTGFVGIAAAAWTTIGQAFRAERERERGEHLLLAAEDGVLVVDDRGVVVQANPAAERLLCRPDTAAGHALRDLLPKFQGPPADWPLSSEHQVVAEDGRTLTLDIRLSVTFFRELPEYVLIVRDTTDRKELEQQLTDMALTDALTGLANRTLLRDRLDQAQRAARRSSASTAVLFMDLDNFKKVNDSLGHAAGDAVLGEVARRLTETLRSHDSAARLGGDEFAVLLVEADEDIAKMVAERLVKSLSRPIILGSAEATIGASIGMAVSRAGADDADRLLRNADLAMYVAKSQGKGRVALFEPGMHLEALGRLAMEGDLRKALERGEFSLRYQPVVDLATMTVTGVEALVRWERGDQGVVSPDNFVPLAEETGVIVPLGAWVLQEATRWAQRWNELAQGAPAFDVAVNVSARQLREPGFVDIVRATLEDTGVDPHRLVLEVTESILIDEADLVAAQLWQLRTMGVRIAIDDFGTGYSSLARLHSLPVDILKIDRSLVAEIDRGHDEAPIIAATLAMAQSLGLSVTAEGVETAEQLGFLRARACAKAQGYLFSRPLKADAINELIVAPGDLASRVALEAGVPPEISAAERDLTEMVRRAFTADMPFESLVRPLLEELERRTGLQSTYLTRIGWEEGQQEIHHAHNAGQIQVDEGLTVPWEATLCRKLLLDGRAVVEDVPTTYPDSEAARTLGIKTFASVPVHAPDGALFGTLCGVSGTTIAVDSDKVELMTLLARLIGQELPRRTTPLA